MNTRTIWIAGAALVLAGCGGNNENNNYLPMTRKGATAEAVDLATKRLAVGEGAKVAQGTVDFGFKLFRDLVGEKPTKNSFISPLSVGLALGIAYNGAGGATRDEFQKVLGLNNLLVGQANSGYRDLQTTLVGGDKMVVVNVANSIWPDRKFEPKREFLSAATDYFAAKVQPLDLKAPESVGAINDWVKKETEDKIPKLFDKLGEDTICVLVNTVYFHGNWTEPFKKESTAEKPFRAFDGQTTNTPMMSRSGKDFEYQTSDKFAAVRLPYGDGRMNMVILLPNAKSGISPVLKDLNARNWAAWMAKFKRSEGKVTIPKWKVEDNIELVEPLKSIGLASAFDRKKADFSNMANVKAGDLFLSRVIHKTLIDVNEEGTEAAAATGIEVGVTSAPIPQETFEFLADRPFLYAITDSKTGVALFLGVFGKP